MWARLNDVKNSVGTTATWRSSNLYSFCMLIFWWHCSLQKCDVSCAGLQQGCRCGIWQAAARESGDFEATYNHALALQELASHAVNLADEHLRLLQQA